MRWAGMKANRSQLDGALPVTTNEAALPWDPIAWAWGS